MIAFSCELLDSMTAAARLSPRLRVHYNLHASFDESVQRLFNAVEPLSYIPPHRHVSVSSSSSPELLMAVRGAFLLVLFSPAGSVLSVEPFCSYAPDDSVRAGWASGVEVALGDWHTVVSLLPGSVLLEVKAGPFDPSAPKDPAPWAPPEGSPLAPAYLESLRSLAPAH